MVISGDLYSPIRWLVFWQQIGPERGLGGTSLTDQFRKVVFDGLSMSLGSMEEELTLNICLLSWVASLRDLSCSFLLFKSSAYQMIQALSFYDIHLNKSSYTIMKIHWKIPPKNWIVIQMS